MTVPYLSQDFIRSIDSDEDIPDLDSDNEQVSELASNTFNSQVDLDQPTQIKPKKIVSSFNLVIFFLIYLFPSPILVRHLVFVFPLRFFFFPLV